MEGTCNCLISVSYEILQAKLSCGVGREKVSSGWKESPGGAGLLDGCVYFENSSSYKPYDFAICTLLPEKLLNRNTYLQT